MLQKALSFLFYSTETPNYTLCTYVYYTNKIKLTSILSYNMAVTKTELETEIVKVLKRLDKIDQTLKKIEKQMGQLFGKLNKKL